MKAQDLASIIGVIFLAFLLALIINAIFGGRFQVYTPDDFSTNLPGNINKEFNSKELREVLSQDKQKWIDVYQPFSTTPED